MGATALDIPNHSEIAREMLRVVIKDARLIIDEFRDLIACCGSVITLLTFTSAPYTPDTGITPLFRSD